MFSTWILHMVGFALLVRGGISDEMCSHHEVKPGKESAVLDSLQCHNDYMSYAQCTWEVDPQENTRELYYYDADMEEEKLCVSNVSGELLSNGKIFHVCRYNSTRFTLQTSHTLYFKVPCVNRATTLIVAQHGKVSAPVDLTERVADGGGRLLSWKSPYPVSSNITGTLVYQLQYRRYMHDWTIVDNINASEYMIDKESLLSGYNYQARVRARGPVGLWSDWSPLVSWKIHDDGAFNLQCVIEEETTVTCTWQMKTEHVQFMSYHLWCSDSDDACCDDPQLKLRDVELSEFTCSVKTLHPYLLTVELRPVYYSRMFPTSKHVKLSQPDQIHVKEGNGVFVLDWSKPVVSNHIMFFIQLKISNSKTSGISKNLSCNENGTEIDFTDLDPSAEYQAQIRLLPNPDDIFIIQPSEWSQPAVFKMKPVSSYILFAIYVLTAVFVALLFSVILYSGLPVLHRRIKIWKGSIPSPIKSKVLEGMMKKTPGGWPNLQSEKETTSICVLLAADNVSLCKSSVSWEPLLSHNEDVVKMARSGGSNHLHAYVGEGMCKDKSGMNFSGPYILCCEESCTHDKLPDGSMDRVHKCVLGKSERSAPENGGCVVTPPTSLLATQNTDSIDSLPDNPSDEPPAYTPSPDQGCTVLPHPSGYFTMPCVVTG